MGQSAAVVIFNSLHKQTSQAWNRRSDAWKYQHRGAAAFGHSSARTDHLDLTSLAQDSGTVIWTHGILGHSSEFSDLTFLRNSGFLSILSKK